MYSELYNARTSGRQQWQVRVRASYTRSTMVPLISVLVHSFQKKKPHNSMSKGCMQN